MNICIEFIVEKNYGIFQNSIFLKTKLSFIHIIGFIHPYLHKVSQSYISLLKRGISQGSFSPSKSNNTNFIGKMYTQLNHLFTYVAHSFLIFNFQIYFLGFVCLFPCIWFANFYVQSKPKGYILQYSCIVGSHDLVF